MAEHTYSVSGAQSQLPRLVREAEQGYTAAIRRRDETVAFLISKARLEAIVETMEILGSPDAMAAIDAYRAGKTKMHPLSALDS